MKKYIVFDSGSSASQLMFADIKKLDNAEVISELYSISNPILRIINKIHLSGKINRYISIPLKGIWDRYCIMEVAKKHPENDYIFIFTNVSVKKIRAEYLNKINQRENVDLVLVAVDSFVDKELCPLKIMQQVKFSLIYSFDLEDCKKYNLKHTVSLYSKCDGIIPAENQSDLFWIGRAKDRLSSLVKTVCKANEFGLRCEFYILGVDKKDRVSIPGINYINEVVPYDIVLRHILASRCLLDIVQEGQNGMTMRVYEAIFYNKKLITNSSSVKQLTFYSPDKIQIIDRVEDIDFSFLKDKREIDYFYGNEYSPINFLKIIEQDLKQEKSV